MPKKKSNGKMDGIEPTSLLPFPAFSDFEEGMENDDMLEMFQEIGHISTTQAQTAFDLVKLMVEHQEKGTLSPEKILTLYQQAFDEVSKLSPLHKLASESQSS